MALEKPSTMNEPGAVMEVKTYSSAVWPVPLDSARSNTPASPGPMIRLAPVEWHAEQPLALKTVSPLSALPAGPVLAAGAFVGSGAVVAAGACVGSGAVVAVAAAPPAGVGLNSGVGSRGPSGASLVQATAMSSAIERKPMMIVSRFERTLLLLRTLVWGSFRCPWTTDIDSNGVRPGVGLFAESQFTSHLREGQSVLNAGFVASGCARSQERGALAWSVRESAAGARGRFPAALCEAAI